MTTAAAVAPHIEFQQQLPTNARHSLHLTQAIVALVQSACRDHGWTPKLLAQECGRDLTGVVNAGAVVTDRLRKAATHPPVGARPSRQAPRPLCDQCEDGWLVDPKTRLPIRRCTCRTTATTTGRTAP